MYRLARFLKEMKAIINSRPLVYIGDDIDSNIALTPCHFLSLNQDIGIPEINNNSNDPDFCENFVIFC